jgi:dnd system-associated protein 4
MERRIATSQSQVKFLEDLVSPVPGEDYPLFETKQKALIFAAALGYHLQQRSSLVNRDASTAIRFDIFEKNLDDGFVACLGVATQKELGILGAQREDDLAGIFEEYASAGPDGDPEPRLGTARASPSPDRTDGRGPPSSRRRRT